MNCGHIQLNKATSERKPNVNVAYCGKVIALTLLVVEGVMVVEQGRAELQQTCQPPGREKEYASVCRCPGRSPCVMKSKRWRDDATPL